MRRIATVLCAAGALVALLAPASAGAAFGPVTSFNGAGSNSGPFNHPQAAAATASTVYVADTGGNRVGIYSSSGVSQGDLSGSPSSPRDVATDGTLVAAVGSGQVARWLSGVPLGVFGVPTTSYGIALASGIYYVSDTQAGVINKYNGLGQFQGAIGSGQLSQPRGLTTGPDGAIYVADTGNDRIVKLSPDGTLQGTWAMPSYTIVANGQTITGRVDPRDVAVDSVGRVFAPDAGTSSNLVAVFGSDGNLDQLFGAPISDPSPACRVSGPWGITIGGGQLYVVSTAENRVRVFNELSSACPTPNFGSGGGVDRGGDTPGGGGAGTTAGALSDRSAPSVWFSGFPKKKGKKNTNCVRKNFAITVHAQDDVLLRKITLFVNHRRVDSQLIYKQWWDVEVRIPVRKVRRALPRGASVPVLIAARVIDQSGKTTWAKRGFKICR